MLESSYICHIYEKLLLLPIRLSYHVNMWKFLSWKHVLSPILKGQRV